MSKWFLRFADRLITSVLALLLTLSAFYAGFAIWDNSQIYASAETIQAEMQEIRDSAYAADLKAEEEAELAQLQELFGKLYEINPDIVAWINMDGEGVNIDYAIVQGRTNFDYLSKDIYGNFSIVGSVFMDFRNSPACTDRYSLIYGHNMTEHRMLSDINEYKQEQFFIDHQTGTLFAPSGIHPLISLSVILTSASDSYIFNPQSWIDMPLNLMLETIRRNALYINEAGMDALQAKIDADEYFQIFALSTCSNEFTDARTILLTLMDPWAKGGSEYE